MKIVKPLIFTFSILIIASVSVCTRADNYSFSKMRRQLKAMDAKLKPINDTRASLQASSYGPGDYERKIQSGGRTRRYEIHIPSGYNQKKRWPVVINFHGGAGRAAIARLESGLDTKADSAGFIAVYPDGTSRFRNRLLTWNAGACCGYAVKNHVDDVQFTRDLLDDLARLFRIDPYRIYTTGLSNGAFMSYRVACELADRIAAIAPIAGVMTVDECKPIGPVSIIHFHGKLDEFSPYGGGVGEKSISKTDYLSVDQTIRKWVRFNGIPPTPVNKKQKGHAEITTYRGQDGTEVVLVTLEGMGHTWPGGERTVAERIVGPISRTISATDMMWDFFQHHSSKPHTDKNVKKK